MTSTPFAWLSRLLRMSEYISKFSLLHSQVAPSSGPSNWSCQKFSEDVWSYVWCLRMTSSRISHRPLPAPRRKGSRRHTSSSLAELIKW